MIFGKCTDGSCFETSEVTENFSKFSIRNVGNKKVIIH